ncbi:MAG TPA: nuclear transport factor 2 family protein, partial [Arachidicoccus sp.]
MKTRILIIIIATLPFINACNQKHTQIADRIEIQDLINAYSHCADNREAQKQAELFTENALVKVLNGKSTEPV